MRGLSQAPSNETLQPTASGAIITMAGELDAGLPPLWLDGPRLNAGVRSQLSSLGFQTMSRRQSMGAADFARELAKDADYQARVRERVARAEAQARECAEDEAGLVAELRAAGVVVESVYDLVSAGGAPGAAVPVLVAHLERPHHPRIWEGIVRALSTKEARTGALEALRAHFRSESEVGRRWLLANALGSMARLAEVRDLDGITEYRALFRQSRKPAHVPPAT
jgi:hypothetical protein